MIDGLRVVLQALNDVRRQGYVYIWANLAFVVLSLPVVTMPAALVALFTVSHHAQTEGARRGFDLFWETFKAHVLEGAAVGAGNGGLWVRGRQQPDQLCALQRAGDPDFARRVDARSRRLDGAAAVHLAAVSGDGRA
ncbi:MAG: DUF624 domain-containing protein [Chloroflexi bacterium]|nr:DUF624 domain-containing protein [Chloroflexota bacterium]